MVKNTHMNANMISALRSTQDLVPTISGKEWGFDRQIGLNESAATKKELKALYKLLQPSGVIPGCETRLELTAVKFFWSRGSSMVHLSNQVALCFHKDHWLEVYRAVLSVSRSSVSEYVYIGVTVVHYGKPSCVIVIVGHGEGL